MPTTSTTASALGPICASGPTGARSSSFRGEPRERTWSALRDMSAAQAHDQETLSAAAKAGAQAAEASERVERLERPRRGRANSYAISTTKIVPEKDGFEPEIRFSVLPTTQSAARRSGPNGEMRHAVDEPASFRRIVDDEAFSRSAARARTASAPGWRR